MGGANLPLTLLQLPLMSNYACDESLAPIPCLDSTVAGSQTRVRLMFEQTADSRFRQSPEMSANPKAGQAANATHGETSFVRPPHSDAGQPEHPRRFSLIKASTARGVVHSGSLSIALQRRAEVRGGGLLEVLRHQT